MSDIPPGSIEKQYGPFLIGVFFNAVLYGVLLVQAYIYFHQSNFDGRWTHWIIIVLLIAETINTGLDFDMVWEPLVQNFGHLSVNTPLMLATDPVTTSFISTIVQVYLGLRIQKLTKSNLLAGLIFFLALLSLAAGITSTIYVAYLPAFSSIQQYIWALMTWLIASATCDIVISISLVGFLMKYKSDSLLRTESIVNKIIILTIQTGIITSVAAIADVAAFSLVQKGTSIQFIWDLSLSKLYTNSLLSTLNARAHWNRLLEEENEAPSISNISFDVERIAGCSEKSQDSDSVVDITELDTSRSIYTKSVHSYQSHEP